MKLPQFLSSVDSSAKNMTQEELEIFIHEIARKLPESIRDEFLDLMKRCSDTQNNESESKPGNRSETDEKTEIKEQIKEIISRLELINSGEVCLDSEYNQEWDDWYHSDEEEFLFSDPENLAKDVQAAINLIHRCFDMELFEDGCKLCETVCYLEISVTGDYCDDIGDPLEIRDLFTHEFLSGSYDHFVKESLYLTYVGNSLSDRAEELFWLFEQFSGSGVRLEDLLQMGEHELPEFDSFLPMWIDYLGSQPSRRAADLLKEAQSMITDDFSLLENARKYVHEHPELYLQILQMKSESGEEEKMLGIGLEAISLIPPGLQIRSRIALLTACFADRLNRFDVREKCWLEAFKSDTSITNYMRIKFLPWDPEQYHAQILSITDSAYKESMRKGYSYSNPADNMRENYFSQYAYCAILFFEQQFDKMEETGMSVKQNLGWSSTFMKEGMALLMLLLFRGDTYRTGMKAMLNRAISGLGFKQEELYFGTNETEEKLDSEVFCSLFGKWKDTVTLSKADECKWMAKIENWIDRRVTGIMDANKRNYYGECAEYIAAFGEVQESMGIRGAKAGIMEKYKTEYPRRRAFHEELRRFGMKR